jgi:hypothetical protein
LVVVVNLSVAAGTRKGKNLPLPEEFSRKTAAKKTGLGEGEVSFLLVGIGVFALLAGLVMVGFGIPINEFSFGNTLIMAGTTAAVGGLIIIGLGMAVGQLRRIAEALAFQSHARPIQPAESLESAGRTAPAQGRSAFPPRPKAEPHPFDMAASAPAGDRASPFAAPKLHNPDEPAVAVEDDISLSPQQPSGAIESSSAAKAPEPAPAPTQMRPPPAPNFDAMWPAEPKPPAKAPASEPRPETTPDAIPFRGVKRVEPEPQKPRAVAILKSGVVDGMGYTLYVDGSIEAELPQGTLRFASINELRSHLEKNT